MQRIKGCADVLICILAICILAGCGGKQDVSAEFEEIKEVKKEKETGEEGAEPPKNSDGISIEKEDQTVIFVHVCGQVNSPGVYELDEGSRVFMAIECAGGVTQDACEEALNLAGVLTDGERIYVPSVEETRDALFQSGDDASEGGQSNLISINRAGKEELMTLTGIGETRAQAIITYREQNGGFSKIEDLMNVEGIKEGTFNKIKEDVKL